MAGYEIVFSPTGGTQRVSDILATALGLPFSTIDLASPAFASKAWALEADDFALIAMPSFAGRAPQVAVERLRMIHGDGANAVVVCVYGNRAFDDTLVEMEDAARDAGFNVVAGISAIAQHSVMPEYAYGRPNGLDRRHLEDFAHRIKELLQFEHFNVRPEIPGEHPYKKVKATPLVPQLKKGCIRCGLCAQSCPVQAIDYVSFKPKNEACISCMRCAKVCPTEARQVNPMVVKLATLAIRKDEKEYKEAKLYL